MNKQVRRGTGGSATHLSGCLLLLSHNVLGQALMPLLIALIKEVQSEADAITAPCWLHLPKPCPIPLITCVPVNPVKGAAACPPCRLPACVCAGRGG